MVTIENFDELENVSGGLPVAAALVLASPVVRSLAAEFALAAVAGAAGVFLGD